MDIKVGKEGREGRVKVSIIILVAILRGKEDRGNKRRTRRNISGLGLDQKGREQRGEDSTIRVREVKGEGLEGLKIVRVKKEERQDREGRVEQV